MNENQKKSNAIQTEPEYRSWIEFQSEVFRTPDNTPGIPPVYLVQNDDCYFRLYQMTGINDFEKIQQRIFKFSMFESELSKDKPEFLPIPKSDGYLTVPVVIIYENSSDKRIIQYQTLLGAGNIPVFRQHIDNCLGIIRESTPEKVRTAINEQYSERYSAKAYIERFKARIEQERQTGAITSTGYPELDRVLDGGLYSGLYALGGGTGTGKTTWLLNLAEHIARSGNQILMIALEMSREELFAKLISNISVRVCERLQLSQEHALTTRDILKGGKWNESDQDKLVRDESLRDFAEHIAPNIYIYESIGNCTIETVRDLITNHKSHTGTNPVVMIDYLQIMSHSDKYLRTNDKAKTDDNILGLKQISRDFGLAMLIVSSLNRDSYKDVSTSVELTSFKESGAIEYSCDVVLGLQMSVVTDINLSKDKQESSRLSNTIGEEIRAIPKRLDIKVLKNRHGEFGGIVRFEFDQRRNTFTEITRVRTERTPEQKRSDRQKELTSFD